MTALFVTVSGEPEQQFDGARPVIVGRAPTCDLVVNHPSVSREHVLLELRGGQWFVSDTSRHGTFLGDEQIGTRAVGRGELMVLRLGDGSGPALKVRPDLSAEPYALPTMNAAIILAGAPEGVAAVHRLSGTPLSIGRVAGNNVVVDDLLASRHHATVVLAGPGTAVVTDLGGRNGTFVNGRRITRATLAARDRLSIGRQTFEYDGQATLIRHGRRPGHASLAAESLSVRYGKVPVLSDVSFEVQPGSLLAIIGPSGAGKSTLLRALTGSRGADSGRVLVDGIDFYPAYDEVRHRIGLVPQEDILHDQLTVGQALGYAAALRLPDDVPVAVRAARVDSVLAQLDLTRQRDLPIHRLSGGQRKRASTAMELLTEPSLLYLDEPTSGLDPLLDREVMRELRNLADRGRTVVVVTHSTLQLHRCDQVLVMARGGRVAYFGPPDKLLAHFGAQDYADVFTELSEEATSWAGRHAGAEPPKRQRVATERAPAPPMQSGVRQLRLLLARSGALLFADKRQLGLLLGLPLVLAAVVQTVPSDAGLALKPGPLQLGAATLLVILVIGAAFMGMATTIRELVAERPVYLREWAIGLRPGAYLGSKVALSALLCAVQAVLLGGLGLLGRDLPPSGLLLSSARLELILVLAVTAFTASMAGLLASALVERSEHTMSVLVVGVMAQLVLSGGLFSIGDRRWLEAIALFSPTRWGFAAAASSVDLRTFHVILPPDALWKHTPAGWWQAMFSLLGLGTGYLLLAYVALRRREQRPRRGTKSLTMK